MTAIHEWIVPQGQAGRRIDLWLKEHIESLSRARLQALIRTGRATVNGKPVKGHTPTRPGDRIRLEIPPPVSARVEPENIPLSILYEDADILVLDKPAGLVVHPGAGRFSGTLVNALLHHCRDLKGIGGELRPGIVHRLDKDTSGALVIAKNEAALQGLSGQFKRREVTKDYLALVTGHLKPGSGRIETLIGRHPVRRQRMAVRTRGGRQAVTVYETLEQWPRASLLKIRIETGRTHQIRVHLSHLGHPVLGDTQYGTGSWRVFPAPLPRQMLHAGYIVFRHPRNGKRMEFTAPLPSDMAAVIDLMGGPRPPDCRPTRDPA